MFSKKKCERCGKEYRMRTISENRGEYLRNDCVTHCSVCEKKLPISHRFGEQSSLFTAFTIPYTEARKEYLEKPWIGSGLCMECYNAKVEKEQKEQKLPREAQLRQAKEILETPTVWKCEYCKTVNRGNFCSNCGSPRR